MQQGRKYNPGTDCSMSKLCIFFFTLVLLTPAFAQNRVELDSGTITVLDLPSGVYSVRGIPYAQPPVGPLRWCPPQPTQGWKGLRDGTQFAPSCPQPTSGMKIGDAGQSEDCLYLNVWSNGLKRGKRPVIVWIHGGGFIMGSGSQSLYDGEVFAQNGAVLVTVNYRLGPFGFMAHPLLSEESPNGVSGNYGLLDVIAALEWVRDNIDTFGGDPANVTIMGESSGAVSVGCLLTSPLAKGLFHRAIMESGVPDVKTTLPQAEKQGEKIAEQLRLDEVTLDTLRSVSAKDLLKGANPSVGMFGKGNQMGPAVDEWLLPAVPMQQIESGLTSPVPVLLGTNANEGTMFYKQLGLDTPESYRSLVKRLFPVGAEKVLEYFSVTDQASVAPVASDLFTVSRFTAPARRTARALAKRGYPVWLYQFSRSNAFTQKMNLGATHGSEVPYVFGTLPAKMADDTDRNLSKVMNTAWIEFAGSGKPGGAGPPPWRAYSIDTQDYMDFGDRLSAKTALRDEACDLIDSVSR
jgi:para-nitrobenzyl esterase